MKIALEGLRSTLQLMREERDAVEQELKQLLAELDAGIVGMEAMVRRHEGTTTLGNIMQNAAAKAAEQTLQANKVSELIVTTLQNEPGQRVVDITRSIMRATGVDNHNSVQTQVSRALKRGLNEQFIQTEGKFWSLHPSIAHPQPSLPDHSDLV